MRDLIDNNGYIFWSDNFDLESAYRECKNIFDGITDDRSFQEADMGTILYHAHEIIFALKASVSEPYEMYAKGFNDAKRDIAMSGEYERIYKRGYEDGRSASPETLGGERDLILRKEAIDAMRSLFKRIPTAAIRAMDALEHLPSAQPQKSTEERTETHSCDLISRQAAIDAARKCRIIEVTPAYMLIDKAEIMTELMCLPSAQPEIIHCRECKHHIDGFFCQKANHHTSDTDCCASEFGAERREE